MDVGSRFLRHLRLMVKEHRKILVIAGVFPPERIAEADHAFRVSLELAKRGFRIEVLTQQGAVAGPELPFRVHPIMSRWSWYELPRLLKIARRVAPDVVHLWFLGNIYHFHPMITFVPALLKRLLPNTAVVTQVSFPVPSGAYRFPLSTRLARKAFAVGFGPARIDYGYGALLRDSDSVIVMAPGHLDTLATHCSGLARKTILIPPPPLLQMAPATAESRARGRKALGLAEDDFVFAYFGRLYRLKGLETLLEAFHLLRRRHPRVKLAVIGGADPGWSDSDWKVEQLYEMARTLDIEDGIAWSGEFPFDSDLGSAYLRAADCAVLPFDRGVALNNSSFAGVAAHALATLATRGDTLDSPFREGENVLLCPPLNPPAMADAMERLLADPQLRARLHSGIEALAREWFSWEGSIDRTIAAFDIGGAPSPADTVQRAAVRAEGL